MDEGGRRWTFYRALAAAEDGESCWRKVWERLWEELHDTETRVLETCASDIRQRNGGRYSHGRPP
jgi:hypothetical protein